MDIPLSVLEAYHFEQQPPRASVFGSGLINHTWKISDGNKTYILQQVNTDVFSRPNAIARNIDKIADYLGLYAPGYYFVKPVPSNSGQTMVQAGGDYYRMFPFVQGSHAKSTLDNAAQALEAARQFGRFTALLAGFDANRLEITLPEFHNLSLRYSQFEDAVRQGDPKRIEQSAELIGFLRSHTGIVKQFESIRRNQDFQLRVTHHDTKISNVLFDESDRGICVIDLDTVMPGYFISDVGDMMRTYLSPAGEEESDFSKISVRDDVYKAIVEGYGSELRDQLTPAEQASFFYAGTCMIYMQALRFLTDHLNNDRYYGAAYEGHNLVRAGNQAVLLECLLNKEKVCRSFIPSYEK